MWLKTTVALVSELLNLGEVISEITPWEEDSDAGIELQNDVSLSVADDGTVSLSWWNEEGEYMDEFGMWGNGYTNRLEIAKRACELVKDVESKKTIETSK